MIRVFRDKIAAALIALVPLVPGGAQAALVNPGFETGET
jgi:hypothetical protein